MTTSLVTKRQCVATTIKGTQCRATAYYGLYCALHTDLHNAARGLPRVLRPRTVR